MITRSCNALLALRMRVRMSATGSVSISVLPAALLHARDGALVRELAEADPAKAEPAEDRARASATVAARVVADLVPLRARLLDDQRLLSQPAPFFRPRPRTAFRARRGVHAPVRRSRRWW